MVACRGARVSNRSLGRKGGNPAQDAIDQAQKILETARREGTGAYAEGRGIQLESLLQAPLQRKPSQATKRPQNEKPTEGIYGFNLESLLVAAHPFLPPPMPQPMSPMDRPMPRSMQSFQPAPPPPQMDNSYARTGMYGMYLESLLQSAANAVPDEKASETTDSTDDDVKSAKSGHTERSSSTTAASSSPTVVVAPEPLSVYDATAQALRTLSGAAVTRSVLALQVHTNEDLAAVAKAVLERAYSNPGTSVMCADLVAALLPFMVTAYDGTKAVTLLDKVMESCQSSLSTVISASPDESVFGAVLFIAHLFVRKLISLAVVKDVFAQLLFTEAPPMDHAVNLGCHALSTCIAALNVSPAGKLMAEYAVQRIKELRGRNYSSDTRAAIDAVLHQESMRKSMEEAAQQSAAWTGQRGPRSFRGVVARSPMRRQMSGKPVERLIRS